MVFALVGREIARILPRRPKAEPGASTATIRGPRASGGIGRRAGFRFLCPQGRGGSTPPSPTARERRRGRRRSPPAPPPRLRCEVVQRELHQLVPGVIARDVLEAEPDVQRAEVGVRRIHRRRGAFDEPDIFGRGIGPVQRVGAAPDGGRVADRPSRTSHSRSRCPRRSPARRCRRSTHPGPGSPSPARRRSRPRRPCRPMRTGPPVHSTQPAERPDAAFQPSASKSLPPQSAPRYWNRCGCMTSGLEGSAHPETQLPVSASSPVLGVVCLSRSGSVTQSSCPGAWASRNRKSQFCSVS